MKPKKHISFGSLHNFMSNHIHQYPDWRQESKIDYSIHDAVMSGFACMYYQSPSLLQFQKELEDKEKNNNLRTLFGVSNIPENTQLRNIVDKVDSSISALFSKNSWLVCRGGKHLKQFQFLDGKYICDIDGT